MWSDLNEWFWSERIWLRPDAKWADLEDRDGKVFPHPRDLLAALPLALALVALRFAFERFIALPIGHWLGIQNQPRRPAKPIPTLERYFVTVGPKPKEDQLEFLAAVCKLTLNQTRRWFRRRRNQDRIPLGKKFREASWRFTYFLFISLAGFSILYHEPWLWRPVMCWDNYPHQSLKPSLYYWYLLELSFFTSLFITAPLDIKRKDFKEQMLHHTVTILLIFFSYSTNLIRVGSLVMLPLDCTNSFLEIAKIFSYTKYQKVSQVLFFIFALVFLSLRMVIFPTQILYTTYYDSIDGTGPFFGYYFFNILLMMIQVLQTFWSYLIVRMLYNFNWKGKVGRDIRSDVEESDSSDSEVVEKNPPLQDGVAHRPGATTSDGPRSRATTNQNTCGPRSR
ncbi:ceramide synthase 4-like [Suncus etruscus]|uniref:ceramide synthase 4-like n=1 Tax=Suncus etruscus TaxID=109475 RepID=UPI0021106077|nr:ceramide synthase 4-like [Suncus etruscus]